MKKIELNAKGLACPQPVIMAKKALAEIDAGEVLVTVDSEHTKENIVRMAQGEGCAVTAQHITDSEFLVCITKQAEAACTISSFQAASDTSGPIIYMFDSDFIGSNRELGKVLVNGFLNAIAELPEKKNTKLILISNGVKLAVDGSYVLENLKKLIERGAEILICGTCLNYFKIRNKVKIGAISNALEIMETLTSAGKVIKF